MNMTSRLARMGLFDAKVPRYTSYPTAPQFKKDIGPAQMRDWITAIAPGTRISLYLHVPFCRKLCWFCACRTQGTPSAAPVRAYLETLLKEVALVGQMLPEGVTLSRMHWGGGTPTLLDKAMIAELAGGIADVMPLADNAEFSVEIDPNEIDQARVDALAAAGMTRASIGVQDFDQEIQKTIGRLQGFDHSGGLGITKNKVAISTSRKDHPVRQSNGTRDGIRRLGGPRQLRLTFTAYRGAD